MDRFDLIIPSDFNRLGFSWRWMSANYLVRLVGIPIDTMQVNQLLQNCKAILEKQNWLGMIGTQIDQYGQYGYGCRNSFKSREMSVLLRFDKSSTAQVQPVLSMKRGARHSWLMFCRKNQKWLKHRDAHAKTVMWKTCHLCNLCNLGTMENSAPPSTSAVMIEFNCSCLHSFERWWLKSRRRGVTGHLCQQKAGWRNGKNCNLEIGYRAGQHAPYH